MFDIGWGELVVIGVVALIAIGPKELPGVLRTVGQAMAKVRRMASEFQGQFQEAMREAELADIKKEAEKLGDFSSVNPLADTQRDIEKAFEDKSPAARSAPLPEVKLDVPLPDAPAPVGDADFAAKPADNAAVPPTAGGKGAS